MVEVFRVKNHDFTPKNHIVFQLFLGGGEGGEASGAAPWIRPCILLIQSLHQRGGI